MILARAKRAVESKGKGQFSRVKWEKTLKTRKGVTDKVQKYSEVTASFGIDYDNMKLVQEKRELGILPKENAGLPWGTWMDENFIEHKDNKYLRLYLVPNNHVKSEYYINGEPASKEECEKLCLASEFRKSTEEPTVFTINVDNIVFIK